jgi:hypothetical protein
MGGGGTWNRLAWWFIRGGILDFKVSVQSEHAGII